MITSSAYYPLRLTSLTGRRLTCSLLANVCAQHHRSVAILESATERRPAHPASNNLSHGVRHFHTSSLHLAKDFYKVLALKKDATQPEVKKAYFKLAKQYHPDMNKDDKKAAAKFQEVSEAYEVLSDTGKRAEYDQFGSAGASGFGNATGGFGGGGGGRAEQYSTHVDAEELFRRVFTEFNKRSGGQQQAAGGFGDAFNIFGNSFKNYADSSEGIGATQQCTMDLSFLEAARGCEKRVTVNVVESCQKCSGNKTEPGYKMVMCPFCHGSGVQSFSQNGFLLQQTCQKCAGSGQYNKNPCHECHGHGANVQKKVVKVPVPAGVQHGQTVRMPVGLKDLFITFSVAKSNTFRREESDVHSEASISVSQAVLGGQIRVPSINEDAYVQITPGTSSHARIRLQGKGIKKLNSYGYGDHYVHVRVIIPTKLGSRQKALMQSYAELEQDTPGSVFGVTHNTQGDNVVADDHSGLVGKIREVLKPESQQRTIDVKTDDIKDEDVFNESEAEDIKAAEIDNVTDESKPVEEDSKAEESNDTTATKTSKSAAA